MTLNNVRIFFMFVISIVLMGFVFVSSSKLKTYKEVQDRLRQKNQDLTLLQNDIKMINADIDKYKADQDEMEKYLFADQDVPAFIDGISQYANKTGIVILDMKSSKFEAVKFSSTIEQQSNSVKSAAARGSRNARNSEENEGMTLAAMPIYIKATGTYTDFVNFLNLMEGFKQLLTFSDLSINVTKDYPLLNTNFVIKIYSFKNYSELKGI